MFQVTTTRASDTVAPTNTEEVSKLLCFANESGLQVCPTGSGSKLAWLNEPRVDQAHMSLPMGRMSAVLEHTWQDMTCTVQAGCTWQALQNALLQHGQQVALDPHWPERATVGGVIAANDSGALRLRYGGLRDLLIGMTVVLADGTVARSGGKVVKNVAGYDLPKLFCGSFGTLGVITEATFRLHAIKRHRSTLTVRSAAVEPLGKLLLRVLASHLSVEAMQLRTAESSFALDVQLAGSPEVLEHQAAQFFALAREAGVAERADRGAPEVWSAREKLFSQIDGPHGEHTHIVFKLNVLPGQLAVTMQAIATMGGEAVAQATGIITARVPAGQVEALTRLRTQAEAQGGSLSILLLPASVTLSRWGTEPSSLPLMRAVKTKFDPRNVLNAGRYLGGI